MNWQQSHGCQKLIDAHGSHRTPTIAQTAEKAGIARIILAMIEKNQDAAGSTAHLQRSQQSRDGLASQDVLDLHNIRQLVFNIMADRCIMVLIHHTWVFIKHF